MRRFVELVGMQFLRDRLRIAAGHRRPGMPRRPSAGHRSDRPRTRRRAAGQQQHAKSGLFNGHFDHSRSRIGTRGDDHNVVLRLHPNCEGRLVTGHWARDAVHGLPARKALVRPSPINLHILVNCLRPLFSLLSRAVPPPSCCRSRNSSRPCSPAPRRPWRSPRLRRTGRSSGCCAAYVDPSHRAHPRHFRSGTHSASEQPPRLGGAARQHVHRGRSRRARRAPARDLERPGAGRGRYRRRTIARSPARSPRAWCIASCIVRCPRRACACSSKPRCAATKWKTSSARSSRCAPDFSQLEAPKADAPRGASSASLRIALIGLVLVAAAAGGWYLPSPARKSPADTATVAEVVSHAGRGNARAGCRTRAAGAARREARPAEAGRATLRPSADARRTPRPMPPAARRRAWPTTCARASSPPLPSRARRGTGAHAAHRSRRRSEAAGRDRRRRPC